MSPCMSSPIDPHPTRFYYIRDGKTPVISLAYGRIEGKKYLFGWSLLRDGDVCDKEKGRTIALERMMSTRGVEARTVVVQDDDKEEKVVKNIMIKFIQVFAERFKGSVMRERLRQLLALWIKDKIHHDV